MWGSGKHGGFQGLIGANMGRLTPYSFDDTHTNIRILDNLLLRVFDVAFGNVSNATECEIGYNAIEVIDDTCQFHQRIKKEEVHHNYIVGPLYGAQAATPTSNLQKYIHHNVCVLTRWRIWRERRIWSWTVFTPHSTQRTTGGTGLQYGHLHQPAAREQHERL